MLRGEVVCELAKPQSLPGEFLWPRSKYRRARLSAQAAEGALHCLQGERWCVRAVGSNTLCSQALICLAVFVLYRCDLIW